MKRKSKARSRWTFPHLVPPGISVYKPPGATSATSWILQYRLPGAAKRSTERPGADELQVSHRVIAIAALARQMELNPSEGRYAAMDRRPLTSEDKNRPGHLEDYRAFLTARSTKNAAQVYARARRVIYACRFERISDVTPAKVASAIAAFKDERVDKAVRATAAARGCRHAGKCPHCGRGHDRSPEGPCMRCAKRIAEGKPVDADALKAAELSPRTRNGHLIAIKQFTAWLAGLERRAKEDRLEDLSRWNVRVDEKHRRQDLGADGAAALIAAARRGPAVLGMSAEDRAWLWEAAVETGFRANELRTLVNKPDVFRLDDEHPVIVVKASYSKHRREDHQPIEPAFARRLKTYLSTRAAGAVVWDVPDSPVDLIRPDLERADIAYVDDEGRFADFHSLRHTFICRLVRNPLITPKECQLLARHASIQTTLDYYAHLRLTDTAGAIRRMAPLKQPDQAQAARATGTHGRIDEDRSAAKALQKRVAGSQREASGVIGSIGPESEQKPGNTGDSAGKPGAGEMQLSGLEPLTFGSVDPSAHTDKPEGLEGVTRAARLRRCKKRCNREQDTGPDVPAAIEKINQLIAQARGPKR